MIIFYAQASLLFLFQLIAHASVIYFLFFSFSWLGLVQILIFYFLFTGIGSDAIYHRLLAHGSYKPSKLFYILGNLFATLGGAGSGIAWAANHRAHHRYVDTENDPHSPHHKSAWRIQFFSMFEPVNIRMVTRLLTDSVLIFFHKFYWPIHIIYFMGLYYFYKPGIVTMYLVPAAMNWSMSAFINIFCHKYGYRVCDTNDKSTNNFLIGILSFGEGWHNYHHAHPSDHRCGHGKYELDPVAKIIEWVRV